MVTSYFEKIAIHNFHLIIWQIQIHCLPKEYPAYTLMFEFAQTLRLRDEHMFHIRFSLPVSNLPEFQLHTGMYYLPVFLNQWAAMCF